MLKRFEYVILSFFLALSSIFANPFDSLTTVLGKEGLGGALFELFGNSYFLIAFYFIL